MTSAYFGSPRGLLSSCKTLQRCPVTAEVASSSLVVPAILFKELVFISAKPLRTQKGRAARPCRVPFALFPPCHVATASCVAAPKDSGASEEKTNDSTAACASCFAGLIACV